MTTYFNKISKGFVFVALAAIAITSCETTDLNINDNPNSLTLESADPNYVLNGLQFGIVNQNLSLNQISRGTMRHVSLFGTYASAAGTGTMNGPWANTYSIANNLNLLKDLSEEQDLAAHVGIGQIIEAFAFVNLVDYIGTAVYTEAVNPDFPSPNLDDGKLIYDAMWAQLDEAIANINKGSSIDPEDLFYNGDLSKWIKLANTLKIKMYVQTKLVDISGATAAVNKILASGDFIKDINDDFYAQFGSNISNPDTRYPDFVSNYQVSAGGPYMSNNFMNTLLNGKANPDPRLNYYIYRQTDEDPSGTLLPCAGNANYNYCYIGDGYWGRDHGDDEGIPNDGSLRSTFGIYPAGGAYDDESFLRTPLTTNLGGAGIQPIILSSFTHFWLAEAAFPEPVGLGVNGSSRNYLIDAVKRSLGRIEASSGIEMDSDAKTDYINSVLLDFDNAASDEEKLNVIVREFYLASFGNAAEPYNNYRRTGYPEFPPAVIANTAFPRSYFIPSSEINSNDNPNLEQKSSLTVQVFWDTNPEGFIN